MFKVKVLTVGKSKEEWLREAIYEYEKRLRGRLEIQWNFAKDDAQLTEWARGESLIALDSTGEKMTSEEWSQSVFRLGPRLTFVIGGAGGIPRLILESAKFRWSLSPLTFTHQMVRLILIEQLYRSMEIERGSEYHK